MTRAATIFAFISCLVAVSATGDGQGKVSVPRPLFLMASGKAAGAALSSAGRQATPELLDVLEHIFAASASEKSHVRTVFGWIYNELSAEQISRESKAYGNANAQSSDRAFFHLERSVHDAPVSKVLQQVSSSAEGLGVEKATLALGEQLLGGDIAVKDLSRASSKDAATEIFANNHSLFVEEASPRVNLVLIRLPRDLRVADGLVGSMFDNIRGQCKDRCIMFATSQNQQSLRREEVFDAETFNTRSSVAGMRQLLSMVGAAPSPAPPSSNSNSTGTDPVHMTPEVLSGILVRYVLFLLALLLVF